MPLGHYLSTSLEKSFPRWEQEEVKEEGASATFVKLGLISQRQPTYPELHWEEIIWMEDLEQTLSMGFQKLFSNN